MPSWFRSIASKALEIPASFEEGIPTAFRHAAAKSSKFNTPRRLDRSRRLRSIAASRPPTV
jgi:hypothetical protein